MPLFRFHKKYSSFPRRRPVLSCSHFGGIHSPERLETRKMLTGNDSLPGDSVSVDFETGTTGLSFEIGSNIETFTSVDAYADLSLIHI